MPLSTTTNRGSRLTPSMEYVVWDMEYGISIDACKEEEEVVSQKCVVYCTVQHCTYGM